MDSESEDDRMVLADLSDMSISPHASPLKRKLSELDSVSEEEASAAKRIRLTWPQPHAPTSPMQVDWQPSFGAPLGPPAVPGRHDVTLRPATFELRYEITVKTLTGKRVCVRVAEQDTVGELKCLVHAETGIPPEQQRLMHAGKAMADAKSLGHYGVHPGAVVHLVLALRGGAPPTARTDPSEHAPSSCV